MPSLAGPGIRTDSREPKTVSLEERGAIRRTVAMSTSLQSATDAGTSQGLIIVAEDRIVAFGGAAEYWLEQIGFHAVVAGDPLPLPLLAVVRRLDALDALDELAAVDQSQHPRLPAALRLATPPTPKTNRRRSIRCAGSA